MDADVKAAEVVTGGRRATIRDVAAHAGVSHQTVSRVINGNPNVSATTRSRVAASIADLGYVPSPMPRGLIPSRTHARGAVANRGGGYGATRHLVELGHREIATIVGPRDWPSSAARLDGYRDALRGAGLAEDPALVEYAADWGPESGRAAAARLLARGA